MIPQVLVVVEGDPRSSGRPAEAVRIAAGVAAWRKARISLYLRGDAVLALSEYADELMDGDVFTRFLPIIGETGGSIYIQAACSHLQELGETGVKFETISDDQLTVICSKTTYLLRFSAQSPDAVIASEIPLTFSCPNQPSSLLHILSHPNDDLSTRIITQIGGNGAILDLKLANPDYNQLVDSIFKSEQILVW